MKKNVAIAVILVLAFFTLMEVSYAQPGRHCGNMGANGFGFMVEKLNLTDAQEEQISKLRVEHQKEMIDLREDVRQTRKELRDLMDSDNVTREAFIAIHKKINEKQNALDLARAEHHFDVYELLTDEQRAKAKELRENFRNNNGGFMHGGKNHPRGRR